MQDTYTANRTVVGLFSSANEANRATAELEAAGFSRADISMIAAETSDSWSEHTSGAGEIGKGVAGGAGAGAAVGGGLGLLAGLTALAIPGFGPIIAAGPIAAALTGAGIGAAAGGVIGGLTKVGVPEEDAKHYAEGIRRGGVLVTVRTDETRADDAADILDANGAEDVDEKGNDWTHNAPRIANTPSTPSTLGLTDTDRTLPVVEEQLRVGKRQVPGRAVRVYSHVTETPVEESVDLRNERVKVERRSVDRPATAGDFEAFREGTIELRETREEPIVSKEARVVEEVVIGKDVEHRRETVRDSVRRTDVEVDESGATTDLADYRTDYQTRYSQLGRHFDYYAPAYTTGSTWASDARYRDRDWSTVEPEVRRDWESRGTGAWTEVKDAVRYGWDKVRGRR